MGNTEKVVVIGAGISGLSCAHRLKQLGIRALVLEAKERAGGVIGTIRRNGYLFETGPQCPRFPAPVWQLVRDLNLESSFVPGDPKAKRYIVRNGQLHPAPFSPTGLLTTRLVGLESKMRILGEVFRSSRPPVDEESLAEFVQRKFGVEVLDNLVDPFISTIFFGDSHKMGMESAFPALVEWERMQGSVVRGAIRARKAKRVARTSDDFSADSPNTNGIGLHVTQALPSLGSFRSGMAELPERLSEDLDSRDPLQCADCIRRTFTTRQRNSARWLASLLIEWRGNHSRTPHSGSPRVRCCKSAGNQRSATCFSP